MNDRQHYWNLGFIISVFLLLSCRKERDQSGWETVPKEQSYENIFVDFWNGMNRNYVMWDMDATRWDNMYQTYLPLFSKLDYKNSADGLLAYGYFRKMTADLRDAHFSIAFHSPLLRDSLISPAMERLKRRTDYHEPYAAAYFDTIAQHYLDHPYYDAEYNTDPQHQLRYKAGTIKNTILYLRINSFSIYRAYQSNNQRMKTLLNYVFNKLTDPDLQGIILDLRDNMGGDLYDLNFFVGKFIDKPLRYGSSRSKSKNNPFDYSPWMPAQITPATGAKPFKGKIAVLVNMHSISMAELTTMALKTISNTVVIGERTFGATGFLTPEADLNSGSFQLTDFASITMASVAFRFKDNNSYEGIGFPPDIQISYRKTAENKDLALEKGIQVISP